MFAARKIRKQLEMFAKLESDAIAHYLHERFVTGNDDPDSCPLAVYLSAKIKAPVRVYNRFIMFHNKTVLVPRSLSAFVIGFDVGQYPELLNG